jgi:hypothetical protein
MEMFHVAPNARKPSLHLLASPLRTLRRLPQPHARLWLEGALGVVKAPPHGLVLLKGLSGLLLSESAEVHRNG